jgi:hypothetical protein
MKITKQRLKEIIKEETLSLIEEGVADTLAFRHPEKVAPMLAKILAIEGRLADLADELSGVVTEFSEIAATTQRSSDIGAHSK